MGALMTQIWTRIPMRDQRRLVQLQWWDQILEVFLDDYKIGSLPLADCQIPDWAQVSIYVFSHSDMMPRSTKRHLLPTEMATTTLACKMDLRGGA